MLDAGKFIRELQSLCLDVELMKTKKKPAAYDDMRRVFQDKSIDAVSFATPNHWHALGTVWACQAGKDVYVEKPASHNIFEGRQMIMILAAK